MDRRTLILGGCGLVASANPALATVITDPKPKKPIPITLIFASRVQTWELPNQPPSQKSREQGVLGRAPFQALYFMAAPGLTVVEILLRQRLILTVDEVKREWITRIDSPQGQPIVVGGVPGEGGALFFGYYDGRIYRQLPLTGKKLPDGDDEFHTPFSWQIPPLAPRQLRQYLVVGPQW